MALDRQSGVVSAPWNDAQLAMIEAWQGNEFLHPLTCEIHSHIRLVPTRSALRCDDPNCAYTQTQVPRIVLGDDGR